MCRTFVRDEDGQPVGEIHGYDADGFPQVELWGAYGEELFEADDLPDPDSVPDEDSTDYTYLFEPPPSPQDEAHWALRSRFGR
jgi:hypothetical protein